MFVLVPTAVVDKPSSIQGDPCEGRKVTEHTTGRWGVDWQLWCLVSHLNPALGISAGF